jgi:hypothetical protein
VRAVIPFSDINPKCRTAGCRDSARIHSTSRLNQLFFVFPLKDLNVGEALTTLEVVSEFADRRTELVEKVRSMEAEKASLLADIASLKGRIAVLELGKCAKTLEAELQALRTEKTALEEKASAYEVGAGYDIPPSTTEGLPV